MPSVNRIRYACLVVGMSILVEGFSQSYHPIKTHELAGGISSRRITDDYLSADKNDLVSLDLEYRYTAISPKRLRNFTFNWNRGLAGGKGFNEFAIQYSDAFSISADQQNGFGIYVGYALSSNPVYTKGREGTVARHSWATTSALSLYNVSSYHWKSNRLALELCLPVAGFAARPQHGETYSESIHGLLYNSYSHAFFTSWHNSRAVNLSMEFSTSILHNLGAMIRYRHNLKLLTEGLDFSEQANGFQIGFSYRLR